MRTKAVIFPFDSFGSGGTARGAELLGDMLREVIDDTQLERTPVRQHAFAAKLDVLEIRLDTMDELAEWQSLAAETLQSVHDVDFLLWFTGNHLGCLPLYRALDPGTLILQLDAHLDCYNLHDTHDTLSHGNLLRHVPNAKKRVINIGHRDLFLESKTIGEHFLEAHSAERLATDENMVLTSMTKRMARAKGVWLDIDVDAFDPSICPAVQEPLPCGLFAPHFFRIANAIDFKKLRGVSISEFDPGHDVRDTSLNLLGWLVEWLLLKKYNA
jgi:agmatinase